MRTFYFIFLATICLFFHSCGSDKNDNISYLNGTWVLDSTNNSQYKSDANTNKIIFSGSINYSQTIWSGDVGNINKGVFFIHDNPKRGFKTITLIPDMVLPSSKDTIWLKPQNFDIILLTDQKLVVSLGTEWIKRVNGQVYKYRTIYYFKKNKI